MEIAILRQTRNGDSETATVSFRFGAQAVCVTLETNENQPVVVPAIEINTVGLERPVYVYGALDLKACAEAYVDGDGQRSAEADAYLLKALQKKAQPEDKPAPPNEIPPRPYVDISLRNHTPEQIDNLFEEISRSHNGVFCYDEDFEAVYSGAEWRVTGIRCYNDRVMSAVLDILPNSYRR